MSKISHFMFIDVLGLGIIFVYIRTTKYHIMRMVYGAGAYKL